MGNKDRHIDVLAACSGEVRTQSRWLSRQQWKREVETLSSRAMGEISKYAHSAPNKTNPCDLRSVLAKCAAAQELKVVPLLVHPHSPSREFGGFGPSAWLGVHTARAFNPMTLVADPGVQGRLVDNHRPHRQGYELSRIDGPACCLGQVLGRESPSGG